MVVDDFIRDLLAAVAHQPGASASELVEPLAATPRPSVMYFTRTVEHALFEAERAGLVRQAVDIAEYHPPGTSSPMTTRGWELTEAGAAELAV